MKPLEECYVTQVGKDRSLRNEGSDFFDDDDIIVVSTVNTVYTRIEKGSAQAWIQ